MSDLDICHCGHNRDEHYAPGSYPDPEYPGSTTCAVEDCPCDIYETDLEYDDDSEDYVDG